jgi:hypothetical protein
VIATALQQYNRTMMLGWAARLPDSNPIRTFHDESGIVKWSHGRGSLTYFIDCLGKTSVDGDISRVILAEKSSSLDEVQVFVSSVSLWCRHDHEFAFGKVSFQTAQLASGAQSEP